MPSICNQHNKPPKLLDESSKFLMAHRCIPFLAKIQAAWKVHLRFHKNSEMGRCVKTRKRVLMDILKTWSWTIIIALHKHVLCISQLQPTPDSIQVWILTSQTTGHIKELIGPPNCVLQIQGTDWSTTQCSTKSHIRKSSTNYSHWIMATLAPSGLEYLAFPVKQIAIVCFIFLSLIIT